MTSQPFKGYSPRQGDVLQKRSVELQARPWLDYADITSSNANAAADAVRGGSFDGRPGEWRIVRQGQTVLP